ncbi:MAG: aminoacetone oxidase family FAD-binding enzyme [Clostridia bacterium]|nr:aminoacetone oxidase family FAD-binding enzyme [Clostridia bacterium]
MVYDLIIVGAGAAGLTAAARLANSPVHVLLVDRNPRVGKKLLVTGNGRCNLSNENMSPDLYYEAAPFVHNLYRIMPPADVLAFFESIGLMTTTEDGRIYPRTMAASSVLDTLRGVVEAAPNITILTETSITRLINGPDEFWTVRTDQQATFTCRRLLIAAGGSAAPKTGTDGSGYVLLRMLNLPVTPLSPALVQLKCSHPVLPSLKGIRTQAELTLCISDEPRRVETGELLFTDYGISGICVFQLSRYVSSALANNRQVLIFIHFLPELGTASILDWLKQRLRTLPGSTTLQNSFTGVFQRMLTLAIIKEAGLKPGVPIESLKPSEINRLSRTIQSFPLEITGTTGFENAQVTRGGLSRECISPETMEVLPGLHVAGEIIDCDGPCGGYNLHFAFATALIAADAIRCMP